MSEGEGAVEGRGGGGTAGAASPVVPEARHPPLFRFDRPRHPEGDSAAQDQGRPFPHAARFAHRHLPHRGNRRTGDGTAHRQPDEPVFRESLSRCLRPPAGWSGRGASPLHGRRARLRHARSAAARLRRRAVLPGGGPAVDAQGQGRSAPDGAGRRFPRLPDPPRRRAAERPQPAAVPAETGTLRRPCGGTGRMVASESSDGPLRLCAAGPFIRLPPQGGGGKRTGERGMFFAAVAAATTTGMPGTVARRIGTTTIPPTATTTTITSAFGCWFFPQLCAGGASEPSVFPLRASAWTNRTQPRPGVGRQIAEGDGRGGSTARPRRRRRAGPPCR